MEFGRCPVCGTPLVMAGQTFCGGCGSDLRARASGNPVVNPPTTTSATQTRPPARRFPVGALAVAALVIVVIAAAVVVGPGLIGGGAVVTPQTRSTFVAAASGSAAAATAISTPAGASARTPVATKTATPKAGPTGPIGQWQSFGSVGEGVLGDTAFQLPNGRVAVFSTSSGSSSQASGKSWVVDVATGQTQAGGAMAFSQRIPSAVVLDDGSVFVAGGWKTGNPVSSAEILDAASGQWVAVPSMHNPRALPTVTNLGGGRVLVAGGWISHNADGGYTATNTAEIYDRGTKTWAYTGSMSTPRALASATRLRDGRVLVAGGDRAWVGATGEAVVSSAEVYDPGSGGWTAAGDMSSRRSAHVAGLLPDGRVLVAGGWIDGNERGIASADVYDPNSGWSMVTGMPVASAQASLVTLGDGRLMVIGGVDGSGNASAVVMLFNPATSVWSRTGDLRESVYWPAAVVLKDGRVLAAGGATSAHTSGQLEIIIPPAP